MTGDQRICSQCGRGPFKSIFSHWAHPTVECVHPTPDSSETDVLLGLWLSGASVIQPENAKYPSLQKQSTNKQLLKWAHEELGMWSAGDVSKTKTSEKRRTELEDVWRGTGTVEAAYVLYTRSFPYLSRFREQDILDVDLTPGAARLLYGFRGHTSERTVRFLHPKGDSLASLLTETGFESASYEPPEGQNGYRVRVKQEASQRFATWIRAYDPLPGCKPKFDSLETLA